eukprot:5221829-Pyramimonas_sp.AAC.1
MSFETQNIPTSFNPNAARSSDSLANDWQSAEMADSIRDGSDALATAVASNNGMVHRSLII